MQHFLQFRLGSHNLPIITCLLLLVGFLRTSTLQELTTYAHTVVALLLLTNYTIFANAQLFSHLGNNLLLCLPQTPSLGDFFKKRSLVLY